MRSSQIAVDQSANNFSGNKLAKQKRDRDQNQIKFKASHHDGKNALLSKIIFHRENKRNDSLSSNPSLSSQFIYNSQSNNETSQSQSYLGTNLSQLDPLQPKSNIELPQSSPIPPTLPSNKFESDYTKMYKNFIDSFNGNKNSCNLQKEQENKKLATSLILRHSLKNIRQFNIQSTNIIENTKNNRNKGKKSSKEISSSLLLNKMEKDREYVRKLQEYQPNIYRLLEYDSLHEKKDLPIAVKYVSRQFLNEMTYQSQRFKALYGQKQQNQKDQTKNLALNQDYLKQKQLTSKFVELQIKQIMKLNHQSQPCIPNNNTDWPTQIYKLIFSKFCHLLPQLFSIELAANPNRIPKKKKEFLPHQALVNLCTQKLLIFTSTYEIFQRHKESKDYFEKEAQQIASETLNLANNCKNFLANFEAQRSAIKQKTNQEFSKLITPYFISSQYFPYDLGGQYETYLQYMHHLRSKLEKKQQQNMRAKINGQMIYEVEDKIMETKTTKQVWVKAALNIIKYKKIKPVYKLSREESKEQRHEPAAPIVNPNRQNIQILRKMKNTHQNTFVPTNKSFSYTNLKNSRVEQNPSNTRERLKRLPDISNLNFSVHNSQIGQIKNKKSTRQQKKQELNNYINNLCNRNAHLQHQTDFVHSQSINNRSNKYIKYNKFPFKFGDSIQFYSDDPETCAIVYNAEDINVKQLTLKFMRDRRKYGTNMVVVRVNPSGRSETQEEKRKAIKILQILSCLGANVKIQRILPYRMPEQKYNVSVEIVAFVLRENVQKIWQAFQK